MMSFETTRLVEFNHCDGAGMVFYPRYFEMISSVIEEYFGNALDYPYWSMHFRDRRGIPTARTEAEFHAPSRLGDKLDFALRITRLGNSSVDLKITAACGSEDRLTVASTLVRIDLDSGLSERWPDEITEKMQAT